MQLREPPDQTPEPLLPSGKKAVPAQPDFSRPVQLITVFVARADFPQCALNEHVDIGGFAGIVVEIVKNSIKVRSLEGETMSYNFHVLRKLYGPHPPPEPVETPVIADLPAPPKEPPVRRNIITDPDFDLPLKPVEEFVNRPDFPKCAFGEMLDLRGYTGVVVEIVNRSLKVRSREGSTRSYNADGLKKLYGSSS
jgi:hypothetical protein